MTDDWIKMRDDDWMITKLRRKNGSFSQNVAERIWATDILLLEANKSLNKALDRIEQLETLLEQRDLFIVKQGLWDEFVITLEEKKDE